MSKPLVENIDYFFTNDGLMVMTEKYHNERGYCCGNGCLNCPYDFDAVPEPRRTYLIKKMKATKQKKV